jgi:hypothetical protein
VSSASAALKRYTSSDASGAKLRSGKMDSRVRTVGKELMERVFINPQEALPSVTAKLVTGMKDQFQKTKVIHDWICDNIAYDVETAFSGAGRLQDYESVLKNKKAVCAGYAGLFVQMCSYTDLESTIISGYSKGFGYDGYLGGSSDHDWNAVKISNKWYLLDVTWDAGYVDRWTFVKNYSTDYLFLDSRPFLYSHLAEDEKRQFYAPVLSKEKFVEEPYIAGRYFKYGLELKADSPKYRNEIDGDFSFAITARNPNVELSSGLRTTGQYNIEGAVWQEKSGTTYTFKYDVPDKDNYKGYVFAKMKNAQSVIERIPVSTYEGRILRELESLLAAKKITVKESELFKSSYYKFERNNYYYF